MTERLGGAQRLDGRPWIHDELATYDRLGRKQPHKPWTVLHLMRAVAGVANWFPGTVPHEFWQLVDDGVAEVCCSCTALPLVAYLRWTECACGRFYVWVGEEVHFSLSDTDITAE